MSENVTITVSKENLVKIMMTIEIAITDKEYRLKEMEKKYGTINTESINQNIAHLKAVKKELESQVYGKIML